MIQVTAFVMQFLHYYDSVSTVMLVTDRILLLRCQQSTVQQCRLHIHPLYTELQNCLKKPHSDKSLAQRQYHSLTWRRETHASCWLFPLSTPEILLSHKSLTWKVDSCMNIKSFPQKKISTINWCYFLGGSLHFCLWKTSQHYLNW